MQAPEMIIKPTLSDIKNAMVEAKEKALNHELSNTRDLIQRIALTPTRDLAYMLYWFRRTTNESLSKTAKPIVKATLRSELGILENKFDGYVMVKGLKISITTKQAEALEDKKLLYQDGRSSQAFLNDFFYTGCMLTYPELIEGDDVIIQIPESCFKEGVYRDLNDFQGEEAIITEDIEVDSPTVSVECLAEVFELPKFCVYPLL